MANAEGKTMKKTFRKFKKKGGASSVSRNAPVV